MKVNDNHIIFSSMFFCHIKWKWMERICNGVNNSWYPYNGYYENRHRSSYKNFSLSCISKQTCCKIILLFCYYCTFTPLFSEGRHWCEHDIDIFKMLLQSLKTFSIHIHYLLQTNIAMHWWEKDMALIKIATTVYIHFLSQTLMRD